jgi:hypothetical protein
MLKSMDKTSDSVQTERNKMLRGELYSAMPAKRSAQAVSWFGTFRQESLPREPRAACCELCIFQAEHILGWCLS